VWVSRKETMENRRVRFRREESKAEIVVKVAGVCLAIFVLVFVALEWLVSLPSVEISVSTGEVVTSTGADGRGLDWEAVRKSPHHSYYVP